MPASSRLLTVVASLTALAGCGAPAQPPPAPLLGSPAPAAAYQLQALTGTHAVTVLPATNSVVLNGYTDTVQVKVEVLRVDRVNVPIDFTKLVVVATAVGKVDATGHFAANFKGGVCFLGLTPGLQPDDVIRVTRDGGLYDESKVAQVTCLRPKITDGNVVVNGNATTGFYNDRLPTDQLEVQLVSHAGPFDANGQTVLRAAASNAAGTLAYDAIPVNPGDLTAVYKGLSGPDLTRAVSADCRIVWLGASPDHANESTVFEVLADPFAAAAVLPGCFPGIVNAITTTDHPVITAANAGTDLVFGGTAAPDVTEVGVSVNQGPPAKVFLPPTALPKAWSLVVPAAQAGAGSTVGFNAVATFSTPAGPPISLGAVSPALAQFSLVLPALGAGPHVLTNPLPGAFSAPQLVELKLVPPGGTIYYTTDGTPPTTASSVYQGLPITLKQTTTLAAFAVLPDGTSTPVNTSTFTIGEPPLVLADPPGGTYFISQYVNLVSRQPATIHYTTDGTLPTASSPTYQGTPVLINANHATTRLAYMAIDPAGHASPVVTSLYTINDVIAPTVEAKPYAAPPAVTTLAPAVGPPMVQLLASEDATLYYTTDGSEPSTSSKVYDGRGVVLLAPTPAFGRFPGGASRTVTLKAMAVDLAGLRSATVTGLYRF